MSYNSRDKEKQPGKYLCRLNRSFVLAKHKNVTHTHMCVCVCVLRLIKLVTSC
jgi:hypothetical protein